MFAPPPYAAHVACADGGFAIEAMRAHGGLIGSAPAMLRFMDHYWLTGEPRHGEQQDWVFFGSLPGAFSLARWRPDGVMIVVLFDARGPTPDAFESIREAMDTTTDSIESWPRG